MKVFTKFLFMSVVVGMVAGCASNDAVFVPKLPQPVATKLLDYSNQPANKVFIVAIAPDGDYAFGYDFGQETLEDAVLGATRKLDASREANGVLAKAYIYAINDDIVYEDMIRAAQEAEDGDMSDMDSQLDELEELEGLELMDDEASEELTEEDADEVSEAGLNVPEVEEVDPMFTETAKEDAEETQSEFGETLDDMFSDVVE